VEVDLDRLADFVGGALDGTPDAADVRHLIETDPRWAEAHAALVIADAAMREQLRAWGAEPAPMPDDVLDRIDAALAQAATTQGPAHRPVHDELAARRARRQRRQRWAIGLATAAAVVTCAVGGVAVVVNQSSRSETAGSSAARDNPAAGSAVPSTVTGPNLSQPNGPAALVASGRDYTPDTLGQLSPPPGAKSGQESSDQLRGNQADSGVAGPLARLTDRTALAACLNAIIAEYGGQVTVVDFARYEGSPALIVVVQGARVAAGRRLVVVVGPTCGVGNAIADERHRAVL
jgi:hypothetical protein